MANRTRARGDREPKGRTKSAILLFLAENGESTFTEVREHLQAQYNIRSTKDVKIHLAGLSADDGLALIEKIPHGSGNANSYRIRGGFNGLKRLHNYLNAQGGVPALMKTRYFLDYTASKEFTTKVRTNIVRNQLLELYEGMLDDAGHARILAMLKGVDPEDREAMTAWMKRVRGGDRDDTLSNSFLAMVDLLKEGDIDLLGEIFLDILRLMGPDFSSPVLREFSALMSDLNMNMEELKMVSDVQRISPGALDYLLNSSKNYRMFSPNVFLAYVFSLILQAPGENYALDSLPPVDYARYRRYAAAVPRYSQGSPIALIARSLFIADMIHGRLAVDEVPEETLRLIFS
ncbi:MAG: hypothetical protein A4E28_01265 [Methanocella sp. PtaU1.Bin125]|nr:MAG: hypothetical protein A4E28_01265 [Methanocella sp. PtaU1.Bin125]